MEVTEGHKAFTSVDIFQTRVYHGTLILPSIGGVPPGATFNRKYKLFVGATWIYGASNLYLMISVDLFNPDLAQVK